MNFLAGKIDFDKSEESMRFRYVLLYLYAFRLKNRSFIQRVNFDTDHAAYALELLRSNYAKNSDKKTNANYEKTMIEVCDELNFFINGDEFPYKSSDNYAELHITDSKFLDDLGSIFDLSGIVGFILAGNESCSINLLNELKKYDYSYTLDFSSTRSRANDLLKRRN